MLSASRPPPEKRFSGYSCKIDFDAHVKSFERAMMVEGVTAQMKVMELNHWFANDAAEICNLFYFVENAEEQFHLIMEELKKYYGRKNITAESMLEKILEGNAIKETENKNLNTFLINLRKFYVTSVKLDKQKHLDSPDTINRIIRARVPFLSKRWTKKRVEHNEKWDGRDENESDLKFADLIAIMEQHLKFQDTLKSVMGPTPKKEKNAPTTAAAAPAHVDASNVDQAEKGAEGKKKEEKDAQNEQREKRAPRPRRNPKEQTTETKENKPPKSTNPPGPSTTRPQGKATQNEGWKCIHCEGESFHEILDCSLFILGTVDDRKLMMKKGGHCYRCFARHHRAIDCNQDQITCTKCGGEHHAMLCRAKA